MASILRRSPADEMIVLPPGYAPQLDAAGMNQFQKGMRSASMADEAGDLYGQALEAQQRGLPDAATLRAQADALARRSAIYAPRVTEASDIGSLGDAADWFAGNLGQAMYSTGPSILGSVAGGVVGGPLGALAAGASGAMKAKNLATATRAALAGLKARQAPVALGAYTGATLGGAAPAYSMEANEALLNAMNDPVAAARSPEEQLAAARSKGMINALGEAVFPALVGGRVGTAVAGAAGKMTGRQILREALLTNPLVEGGTETAQEMVGQHYQSQLNPNRDTAGDTKGLWNAFAAGAAAAPVLGSPSTVASTARLYADKAAKAAKDTATSDPAKQALASAKQAFEAGTDIAGKAYEAGKKGMAAADGHIAGGLSGATESLKETLPEAAKATGRAAIDAGKWGWEKAKQAAALVRSLGVGQSDEEALREGVAMSGSPEEMAKKLQTPEQVEQFLRTVSDPDVLAAAYETLNAADMSPRQRQTFEALSQNLADPAAQEQFAKLFAEVNAQTKANGEEGNFSKRTDVIPAIKQAIAPLINSARGIDKDTKATAVGEVAKYIANDRMDLAEHVIRTFFPQEGVAEQVLAQVMDEARLAADPASSRAADLGKQLEKQYGKKLMQAVSAYVTESLDRLSPNDQQRATQAVLSAMHFLKDGSTKPSVARRHALQALKPIDAAYAREYPDAPSQSVSKELLATAARMVGPDVAEKLSDAERKNTLSEQDSLTFIQNALRSVAEKQGLPAEGQRTIGDTQKFIREDLPALAARVYAKMVDRFHKFSKMDDVRVQSDGSARPFIGALDEARKSGALSDEAYAKALSQHEQRMRKLFAEDEVTQSLKNLGMRPSQIATLERLVLREMNDDYRLQTPRIRENTETPTRKLVEDLPYEEEAEQSGYTPEDFAELLEQPLEPERKTLSSGFTEVGDVTVANPDGIPLAAGATVTKGSKTLNALDDLEQEASSKAQGARIERVDALDYLRRTGEDPRALEQRMLADYDRRLEDIKTKLQGMEDQASPEFNNLMQLGEQLAALRDRLANTEIRQFLKEKKHFFVTVSDATGKETDFSAAELRKILPRAAGNDTMEVNDTTVSLKALLRSMTNKRQDSVMGQAEGLDSESPRGKLTLLVAGLAQLMADGHIPATGTQDGLNTYAKFFAGAENTDISDTETLADILPKAPPKDFQPDRIEHMLFPRDRVPAGKEGQMVPVQYKGRTANLNLPALIDATGDALGIVPRTLLGIYKTEGSVEENTYVVPSKLMLSHLLQKGLAMLKESGVKVPEWNSAEIQSAIIYQDIIKPGEDDVKGFEEVRGRDLPVTITKNKDNTYTTSLKQYPGPAALDRDSTVKAEQRVEEAEKQLTRALPRFTGELAAELAGRDSPVTQAVNTYLKARTPEALMAAVNQLSAVSRERGGAALMSLLMADTVMREMDSGGKLGKLLPAEMVNKIKAGVINGLEMMLKERSQVPSAVSDALRSLARAQDELMRSMGWSDPSIPGESEQNVARKSFRDQAENQYEGAEERPGVTLFDQSTLMDMTHADLMAHMRGVQPGELRQLFVNERKLGAWMNSPAPGRGAPQPPKFMTSPVVTSNYLTAYTMVQQMKNPSAELLSLVILQKLAGITPDNTIQQAVKRSQEALSLAEDLRSGFATEADAALDYQGEAKRTPAKGETETGQGAPPRAGPDQRVQGLPNAVEAPLREAKPGGEAQLKAAAKEADTTKAEEAAAERAKKALESLFDPFSKRTGKDGDTGALTAEAMQAIKDLVKQVTNDKVKVEFVENYGAAGQYKDGVIYLNAIKLAESTKFHEVMHWVIEVLDQTPEGKKVLDHLRASVSTPAMRKWLEAQLAGEDEALAQLKSANERVTYAFEFFMRDPSQPLPTGKETRNMFQRLFDWVKRLLNISDQTEQTRRFFLNVASGDFAVNSDNTVAIERMLGRSKSDEVLKKAKEVLAPVREVADAFFNSTIDRARAIGNDKYDEIIDLYANRRTGYIHRAGAEASIYTNLAGAIIENVNEDDRKAALGYLYDPNGVHSARAVEIGTRLKAEVIDPLKALMAASGVALPVVGEMPVVFDVGRVVSNSKEFAADLNKGANSDDVISRIYDQQGAAYAPMSEEKMKKWMSKDLVQTLRGLVFSGINQALLNEKGEDNRTLRQRADALLREGEIRQDGTEESEKNKELMKDFIKSMEGNYGHKVSPKVQRLMSNIIVYQNILLLPFGVMSQMLDVLVQAGRTGDVTQAFTALKRGLSELPRAWFGQPAERDMWEKLAMRLGTAEMFSALSNLSSLYAGISTSGRGHAINEFFFKMNGMQQWNRSMHVAATQAAVMFLLRLKNDPEGQHTASLLKEVGLTLDDIQLDPNSDYGLVINDKIKGAIRQFVTESVAHPDPASNPLWMNDKLFALMAHLKRFSFAWHEYVIKRAGERAGQGDLGPLGMLAGAVPFMVFSDMLRDLVKPGAQDYKKDWGLLQYTWDGVQRAALFGRYNPAVEAATNANPFASILGPMAEQLERAREMLVNRKTGVEDVLKSAIPGKQFFAT